MPTEPTAGVRVTLSRRRDGRVRARVRGYGPDAETTRIAVGGHLCLPPQGVVHSEATFEQDRIAWVIDQLRAGPDPLPASGEELATTYARWQARGVTRRPGVELQVNDRDLRPLVHDRFADPTAIRVDEMSLGLDQVRADVALFAPAAWTGIEIKGQGDSLTRLPRQVRGYSAVFDTCVLVTTPNHAPRALEHVPGWWQVLVADGQDTTAARAGGPNPGASSRARVALLWRDELVWALARVAPDLRTRRLYVEELRDALAERWDPEQARTEVTAAMRWRQGWPSATRRAGFTR